METTEFKFINKENRPKNIYRLLSLDHSKTTNTYDRQGRGKQILYQERSYIWELMKQF